MSAAVDQLRAARPRSRLVRGSVLVLGMGAVGAWGSPELRGAPLWGPRSAANLHRFLGELIPRGAPSPQLLAATIDTLAIALISTAAAALLGALAAPLAARTLAAADPYLAPRPAGRLPVGGALRAGALREGLIAARALPEYLLAFLLTILLGLGVWPVVLALTVHNAGILGRLGAELIEDLEPPALAQLRASGASRGQLAVLGALPQALPRYLLFVFVRWETCIRESTVLGMLGGFSLGWLIGDARARMRYDAMIVYVLVGALLIVAGDMLSQLLRRRMLP